MTREEAVIFLKAELGMMTFTEETKDRIQALYMAIIALEQEQRSMSRWIDADLDPNFAKCKKCSEHKIDIAYSKDFIKQKIWNFCPNCGAKMDKE